MATLLNKLVFDFAHVSAKHVGLSDFNYGLVHWVQGWPVLHVALVDHKLRCCICNFDRVCKQIFSSCTQVALSNPLLRVRRLRLHEFARIWVFLLRTLVKFYNSTIVLVEYLISVALFTLVTFRVGGGD